MRFFISICLSETSNFTSDHLNSVRLHKQVCIIEHMYYESLASLQLSIHIDDELRHRYIATKNKGKLDHSTNKKAMPFHECKANNVLRSYEYNSCPDS